MENQLELAPWLKNVFIYLLLVTFSLDGIFYCLPETW